MDEARARIGGDEIAGQERAGTREEATEMAQRAYRVKDFAAFYIAQIRKLELPWDPDLAKRDAAIAKLRRSLPRPASH